MKVGHLIQFLELELMSQIFFRVHHSTNVRTMHNQLLIDEKFIKF